MALASVLNRRKCSRLSASSRFAAHRKQIQPVADPGIAGGGVLSRASMEGPKVPSEARRREAVLGGSGQSS